MDFHHINSGDRVIYYLVGAFKYTDHGIFQDLLIQIEELNFKELEISLPNLHFIDAAGLGMLLTLIERVEARKLSVGVSNSVGQVKEQLGFTKIRI